ncbi:MAG: superoxide dismutase [Clostridiales bacterium]|nr:superoxide dismutase [Clostridiales bacterium]
MSEKYEFKLKPLPYSFSDLEPYIDSLTMKLHHDRHLKTYIDNLNSVISKHVEYKKWSLEKLIKDSNWLPQDVRSSIKNNAGGVYNHNFYFSNMAPGIKKSSDDEFIEKINHFFGNFDDFKSKFKTKALDVFGSGYAWLVANKDKELKIIQTINQNTPLELDLIPILCIDVWEHAYYLKNYNKRAEYIDNWFNVINWAKLRENYENIDKDEK